MKIRRHYRGDYSSPLFVLYTLIFAIIMLIPVLYVIRSSVSIEWDKLNRLFNQQILTLFGNTLFLIFFTVLFALFLGLPSAILVAKTNIKYKGLFKWLLVIPLTFPSYIGALSYILLYEYDGIIHRLTGALPFNIYRPISVAFILAQFLYPYIFMLAYASLIKINKSYEEAAIGLGLSEFQVIRKVTLKIIRPALISGVLLIALYVMSEFGAISLLRYKTFTSAVYWQIKGRFNTTNASILSVVLMTLNILFIISMNKLNLKTKQAQGARGSGSKQYIFKMNPMGRGVSYLYLILIILNGTVLPLLALGYSAYKGVFHTHVLSSFRMDASYLGYIWNSFFTAFLAAAIGVIIALPVVILKLRNPKWYVKTIEKTYYVGRVLPGIIIGLGLILVVNNFASFLYNTWWLIVIGYIMTSITLGLQSIESSLRMLPKTYEEAAKNLGYNTIKILTKVIVPIIKPGIFTAFLFMFIANMKELSIPLLLRPPSFDTLPIRVWMEYDNGLYNEAAVPALLIVITSILPIRLIMKKYEGERDE